MKIKLLNLQKSSSGFMLAEMRYVLRTGKPTPKAPPGSQALLEQLDILIDGPYMEALAINAPTSLISSKNHRAHVFNPALRDRITWASDQIEVHVLKDGSRIVTGYRGEAGVFE